MDAIAFIERAVEAGLDMIQIREKDLPDRALLALVRKAVSAARGRTTKILVNDRVDIALAAGADGAHLGGRSAPIESVRKATPSGFFVAVSTHSRSEAGEAAARGADFLTFGPVFYTPSKARYGPPVGLAAFAVARASLCVPVLPLGGINESNFDEIIDAGATGAAAISLFQNAENLNELATRLRERAEKRR